MGMRDQLLYGLAALARGVVGTGKAGKEKGSETAGGARVHRVVLPDHERLSACRAQEP